MNPNELIALLNDWDAERDAAIIDDDDYETDAHDMRGVSRDWF